MSPRSRMLPFVRARAAVRRLKLTGLAAWRSMLRSGAALPQGVPRAPHIVYRHSGWGGWPDFLGAGRNTSPHRPRVARLPFAEARRRARSAGLPNRTAYRAWRRVQPTASEWPADPALQYAGTGWLSWGDFLGTDHRSRVDPGYWPFRRARAYMRRVGLRSLGEWRAWCRAGHRPVEIPSAPQIVYSRSATGRTPRGGRARKGPWVDFPDFLGYPRRTAHGVVVRPFTEARRFALALGLSSAQAWRDYAAAGRLPRDIPRSPREVYPEFRGYADFLGLRTAGAHGRHQSFAQQQVFAELAVLAGGDPNPPSIRLTCVPRGRSITASSAPLLRVDYLHSEWRLIAEYDGSIWHQRRMVIDSTKSDLLRREGFRVVRIRQAPLSPLHADDLSVRKGASPHEITSALLDHLATLGFGTSTLHRRWQRYCAERRLVSDHRTLRHVADGWRSLSDASAWARSHGIRTSQSFIAAAREGRLPPDIPRTPWRSYPNWKSWGEFLGTGSKAPGREEYGSLSEAQEWARSAGVLTEQDWEQHVRAGAVPAHIPKAPQNYYKRRGVWPGWPAFLGTVTVGKRRVAATANSPS